MAFVLRFVFEVVTDLSVFPSLYLIQRRRKHFEFFMGVFQFVCSMMYNFCDAFDLDSVFLAQEDWHRLTNITGLSYAANVAVVLMVNQNESLDHLLRYSAFALLWLAQIKDEFWMEDSQWTLFVLFVLGLFCIAKVFVRRKEVLKHYRMRPLKIGVGFGVLAFIFFLTSLDDYHDPFRFKHGIAQLLFGGALYNLWNVVKVSEKMDHLPIGNAHLI